jgi:large subunit ribosomal protein L30
MEEKMITIRLIKSPYGRKPNQDKTLKALGLTKVNQEVTKPDNEAVRGMIAIVSHLVQIV